VFENPSKTPPVGGNLWPSAACILAETAKQVKANLKNPGGRGAELPQGLQLCRSTRRI
jgi:hypothetical protein